jgi:hypothetical protein
MAWAQPHRIASHQAIISNRWSNGTTGSILYLLPSGKWDFWSGTGGGWDTAGGSGEAVKIGEWYQVVGTFDDLDEKPDSSGIYEGTMTLYVNGVEIETKTNARYKPSNVQLDFGVNPTADLGFQGCIDEGGIWGRALTATEVLDNYKMGAP